MARRNVNSQRILTPEDKQYLRRVCRYLASLGMQDGTLEFETDYGNFDFSNINWNEQTSFSNNYSAEVPDGLLPILKKIGDYIEEHSLFDSPDVDDMNYERIDFDIDCEQQEISVSHWWSYYTQGDGSGIAYDGEDGKDLFEEWESDGVFESLEIPNNGILTIKYNGSGDSGFIDGNFDETGDGVPTAIEDWCYRALESHFGGWEINEGSQGDFELNFNNQTINLNHTYNTEETDTKTIYEESFAE